MSATIKAALDHYRDQARLAQFERMREALRKLTEEATVWTANMDGWIRVEMRIEEARAILRDVEGL